MLLFYGFFEDETRQGINEKRKSGIFLILFFTGNPHSGREIYSDLRIL
jgi:hypothetical protein